MAAYLNEHGLETLWGDIGEYVQQQKEPVPTATSEIAGIVKPDNTTLTVSDGTISAVTTAESDGSTAGPIATLTANGHAEQASTTGKNLLHVSEYSIQNSGIAFSFTNDDGPRVHIEGTATVTIGANSYNSDSGLVTLEAGTYTLSGYKAGIQQINVYKRINGLNTYIGSDTGNGFTFTFTETTPVFIYPVVRGGDTVDMDLYPQIELGSTATSYEPYTGGAPSPSPDYPQEIVTVTGHEVTGKTGRYVDLVVKQGDTVLSTTPIPLPSRGWVAGLPDGTADTLTIDGAGKVTWERKTNEVAVAGDMIGGTYNTDGAYTLLDVLDGDLNVASGMCTHFVLGNAFGTCTFIVGAANTRIYFNHFWSAIGASTIADVKAWFTANPVTVLCPLVTPVTEDMGYIDLPQVPENASISIPELDGLGVRYHVSGAAAELAGMYQERTETEIAEPLAMLQGDFAEMVTDAATMRTDIASVATNLAYDAQVINGTYAGRAITDIPELASEISSAGSVYDFLHNRVAAGNFANLRIGDYFDVPVTGYGTIRYLIGAFDHYYNCGDSAMPHHIVCVPNAPVAMPAASSYTVNNNCIIWDTTADNNGTSEEPSPYLASNLHAWEIGEFLPALPSALQGYLKNFRDLVEVRYSESNKLTDSNSWKWADLGKVWSPSEMEVYGTRVWGTKSWSQGMGSQFPIFRNTRDRIRGGRTNWWLRTVQSGSSSNVCGVTGIGGAFHNPATNTGTRPFPCFLLG